MKSLKKKISRQHGNDLPLLAPEGKDAGYDATTHVIIPKRKPSRVSRDSYNSSSPSESLPNSPLSSTPETFFQADRKPKQDPPWVKEAREQSSKEPLVTSDDVRFDLIRLTHDEPWATGLWQSAIILLVFLILPSIIFALAGLIFVRCSVAGRSKSGKRKFRMVIFGLGIGIILSIIKDSIIVITVVNAILQKFVSEYEIAYTIIIFIVLLVIVAPVCLVFILVGVSFTYNDKNNNKKLEAKKKNEHKSGFLAETFMKGNLESLHDVTCLKEQTTYLLKSIQRPVVVLLLVIITVLCILRNILPWLIRMKTSSNDASWENRSVISNISKLVFENNNNTKGATAVMVLSGVNGFAMSLLLSILFIYAIVWQIIMLKRWRKFAEMLSGENDLISLGTDGIVAWWKVYQTLRYLTWSAGTPAGFLLHFIVMLFMIAVTTLSGFLIADLSSQNELQKINVIPMLVDNICFLIGLVMIWFTSSVTSMSQKNVIRQLGLQHLNIADKASISFVAGAADKGEYNASLQKFKARGLRTSLQLLQVILPTIENIETRLFPFAYPLLAALVFIIGFISTLMSIFFKA